MDNKQLNEEIKKILNEEDFEVGEDKLPEKLQALVDGKYDGEEPLAKIVMSDLDNLTVDEIVNIMNTQEDRWNSLYPSGWDIELGEYPVKLAEALVKSNGKESLTDIYNVFYRHEELPEAVVDVFKKDALDDIKNTLDIMDDLADAEVLTDFLDEIAKNYPEFVEQLKAKAKGKYPEILEEA